MEPIAGSAGWTSHAKAMGCMLHQMRAVWKNSETKAMPNAKEPKFTLTEVTPEKAQNSLPLPQAQDKYLRNLKNLRNFTQG